MGNPCHWKSCPRRQISEQRLFKGHHYRHPFFLIGHVMESVLKTSLMRPIQLIKAHKLGKVKKFQLTKCMHFLSLKLKTYYFSLEKIKSYIKCASLAKMRLYGNSIFNFHSVDVSVKIKQHSHYRLYSLLAQFWRPDFLLLPEGLCPLFQEEDAFSLWSLL